MLVASVGALNFFGRFALHLGSSNFRLKLCQFSIKRPCKSPYLTITSSYFIIMRQLSVDAQAVHQNIEGTYEEAVRTLNTLQSNAAYIEKTRIERDKRRHLSIPETIETAKRAGITLADIDKLSVIHISGTKGKGSTCAFIESILRAQGYKTGFFSSPHLVEVRERLRLNGRPISRDSFSSYFWDCYKRLDSTKEAHDGDMPAYFRFMTIMAFHVFIKEKVDVAIMEVGIGGEYDCTNIVRNPVVCGVSSLGIDHTNLLGNTIDSIAWHKGGIFKTGVPAVTVPQPDDSIQVLHDRAYDKGCLLYETPESIYDSEWSAEQKPLGIPGEKQCLNASLAAQVSDIWVQNHTKDLTARLEQYKKYINKTVSKSEYLQKSADLVLSKQIVQGLTQCEWPGRCQTMKLPGVTCYLDGAHTSRSIEVCSHWFKEVSRNEALSKGGRVVTVLLFNATGDRQSEQLLEHFLDCDFDAAVFCPNIASTISLNKADQTNYMVTSSSQLAKCRNNQSAWLRLNERPVNHEYTPPSTPPSERDSSSPDRKIPRTDIPNGVSSVVPEYVGSCNNNSSYKVHTCTKTFGSILESLHWICQGRVSPLPLIHSEIESSRILREADHVQVLCTGSLHLVGGILGLLEPDVCDK